MVYKRRQGSDLAAQSHCPVYMSCGLCGINRAYGSMIYVSSFLFICPYHHLFLFACPKEHICDCPAASFHIEIDIHTESVPFDDRGVVFI